MDLFSIYSGGVMEFIDELMGILGIQTGEAGDLKKNLQMFLPVIINASVEPLPYLYIRAFVHIDARYPYHYRASLTDSGEYSLILTKNGEGALTVGGTEVHAGPGTLCLLPQRLLTSIRIRSSRWEYYQIIFGGAQAGWFFSNFTGGELYRTDISPASRLPGIIYSMETNREYYAQSPLRQLSGLTALLCEAIDGQHSLVQTENIPKYLLAIKQDFDKDYRQYYSLDMLEKKYSINKYKIAKEFTYYFGTAPIHYLTGQRIENAKKLLSTTNLKINEVGHFVGYENTTHFINSFKKLTGMTPLVYRNSRHTF